MLNTLLDTVCHSSSNILDTSTGSKYGMVRRWGVQILRVNKVVWIFAIYLTLLFRAVLKIKVSFYNLLPSHSFTA